MKKAYNQPAMTVVELKLKSNILIGSEITDIDTNLGTGDDIDFGRNFLVKKNFNGNVNDNDNKNSLLSVVRCLLSKKNIRSAAITSEG